MLRDVSYQPILVRSINNRSSEGRGWSGAEHNEEQYQRHAEDGSTTDNTFPFSR